MSKKKKKKTYVMQNDGTWVEKEDSRNLKLQKSNISTSSKSQKGNVGLKREERQKNSDTVSYFNKNRDKFVKKYNANKDVEEALFVQSLNEDAVEQLDEYNENKITDIGSLFDAKKKSGLSLGETYKAARARDRQTSEAKMAEKILKVSEKAKEDKFGSSIISVGENFLGGATALGSYLAQYIIDPDRDFNTNADGMTLMKQAQARRQAVAEELSPVGGFVYNTAMSGIDSLAAMATGGITKTGQFGSLAIMSSQASMSSMTEAKERGLSNEDATMTGLAAGFFESLFEKVSLGNLMKLTQGQTKNIAKEIGKSMLVNASEEAATEFSNIMYDTLMNGALSKATTRAKELKEDGLSEDEIKAQITKEFALQIGEAGAGGALMGGAFGGGGIMLGKALNGPSRVEKTITDNEVRNKVVQTQKERAAHQEVDRLIQEHESTVGELSDKEKESIKADVQKKLEAGELKYANVKLDKEEIAGYEKEVKERIKSGDFTARQVEVIFEGDTLKKIEALEKEVEKRTGTEKIELENKLNDLKLGFKERMKARITSEPFLQEVYKEERAKGQPFEYEAKDTDSDITKALVESMKFVGADNTKKTRNLFEYVNKIANDRERNYAFVNNAKLKELGYDAEGLGINGLVRTSEDGKEKILINVDAVNALNTVVGHETTHLLEDTKEFEEFKKFITEFAESRGDYEKVVARVKQAYEGVANYNLENEVTADLVGSYLFTNEEFIQELATSKPTIFQKIYDFIKHIAKMATAKTEQAKQLEQVEYSFKKAYRATIKANKAVKTDMYSLMQFEDGRRFVEVDVDQEQFDGLSDREKGSLATKIIKERFAGKVVGIDNRVFVNGKGAEEYGFPLKKIGTNEHDAKMRASTELDNLVDAGFNFRQAADGADGHIHKDVVGGFTYFDTIFKVGEKYYQGTINIKNVKNGLLFKDITKIKDVTEDTLDSYGENPKFQFLRTSSKDIISPDSKNNNTKFSLNSSKEETKNLIALHNLNIDKLKQTMKLGGFPMPSIAITKDEIGHTNFGNISVVFSKDTIDPKNKKNKVYGADAWTPTFPRTEYELNDAKVSEIYQKANNVGNVPFLNPVDYYDNNLEDRLSRAQSYEAFVERYKNDYGLKQIYLSETGKGTVDEIKKTVIETMPETEVQMATWYINNESELIESYNIARAKKIKGTQWVSENRDEIKKAYGRYFKENFNFTDEAIENVLENTLTVEMLSPIRNSKKVKNGETSTTREEINTTAMKQVIDSKINEAEYDSWVNEFFDGIIEREGLWNGKDIFTPSGNRRSFASTHYPVNVENIVKAMLAQSDDVRNIAGFNGIKSIRAVAVDEFKSIGDIRGAKNKLKNIDNEEFEAKTDELGSRLYAVMDKILDTRKSSTNNRFIDLDTLGEVILELGSNPTLEQAEKHLNNYRYKVTADQAKEIVDIIEEVKNMPVNMFEAKPQRVVNFDEALAVVIPDNLTAEEKAQIKANFSNVIEYEAGNDEQRKDIVNNIDDAKFQLKKNDEIAPLGDYAIYGKDILMRESDSEIDYDLAPVAQEVINPVSDEPDEILQKAKAEAAEAMPQRGLLQSAIGQTARSIKRSFGSKYDPTKDIKRLYNKWHKGELTEDETVAMATEIGGDIANNIKTKQVRTAEAEEILGMLRKARISLNYEQNLEVQSQYDSYNNYRKSMMGKVIFAEDGVSLDSQWQEWAEMYPDIFDEDVKDTDQPQELADIITNLQKSYDMVELPSAEDIGVEIYSQFSNIPKRKKTHGEIQREYVETMRSYMAQYGEDLDKVLREAKDKSTFSSVDNTPVRFIEKVFGTKAGRLINEMTINKIARDETKAVRWLNSIVDRKDGLLAQLSREYGIKSGSDEAAAARMYAEGFFVDEFNDYRAYGDAELEQDFEDADTRARISGLAKDSRIRDFYDETLDAINESRERNGYAPIPKRDNYFLHFMEMDDTFSELGIPFNPKDIKLKDLPTDLNGVTADLKPGQPYFASSKRRMGVRTTYDIFKGMEKYATSAAPQIYHIDNIQMLRGFRNYVAEQFGQAEGLKGLDELEPAEQEAKIQEVFGAHGSVLAKFLNEEANILAGKTALIDRGLEGVIGRRGIMTLNEINKQVGANMVGWNISSAFTNFLSGVQATAKVSKFDAIKAFTQTVSNRVNMLHGRDDGFLNNNDFYVRRKGSDRFHRTAWQKIADTGYMLMSATDEITTEYILRTKYNELIKKGKTEAEAHREAGDWAARLLGDRSLGQMPQIFNSKMLGLLTKFQLEVRNQLDSMFYDTIKDAEADTQHIQDEQKRNAKKAAKITSTVAQLTVFQHLFGKAFEAVAGYNPAFDILGALITAFGFDDDEDSEDTPGDNLSEAFYDLLEGMPYSSILEGGRIPISSALPIKEFFQEKDEYGNKISLKDKAEIVGSALPYYVLPTGYGQIKKTVKGLKMFDDDFPVAGSYTEAGNLRFPVEENLINKAQAAVFGQYANKNAREYFDRELAPLKAKQIKEYKNLDIPISDYWDYRQSLKEFSTTDEKLSYIDSLDVPIGQKNIMANNVSSRKESIDLNVYKVYGGYQKYKEYKEVLGTFTADKVKGKTVQGSKKKKVIDYINGIDADYGTKLILFKQEYESDDTYNYEIIDYLNSREDISESEMRDILTELGFKVDTSGVVRW